MEIQTASLRADPETDRIQGDTTAAKASRLNKRLAAAVSDPSFRDLHRIGDVRRWVGIGLFRRVTWMLSLDSLRWESLRTYRGAGAELPAAIRKWREAIGGEEEEPLWTDLWERFLHQGTITDAAYAAAPHVVQELKRIAPQNRLDYLVQLGIVESARASQVSPDLPEYLADSYNEAVMEARSYAVACLSLGLRKAEFRYLVSALCSFYGHGELGNLIFDLDALHGVCPECGEWVYPEDIQESGYIGRQQP